MARPRRILVVGVEAIVVIVVVSLLVGQFFGQPVLLGYVETGSMQPTLEPGDGFVAIPTQLVGPIEEGDVVTFRAQELHGGRLTTHRVIERTEEGFITRGDHNPFSDQQVGEPPVKRSRIVSVALQVNGHVVVVPEVGAVVSGTRNSLESFQRRIAAFLGTRSILGVQGLAYLLFSFSAIGYLLDMWLGDETKRRVRETTRNTGYSASLVLFALVLVVVSVATASMVSTSGPQPISIDSVTPGDADEGGIPAGTSETIPLTLSNAGYVPVVAFLESGSDGLAVRDERVSIGPNSQSEVRVTLTAPEETGRYHRTLVVRRYLAVLPPGVTRTLYAVHPLLPVLVIDGLLGGTLALLGVALVGTGRVRFDRERRERPVGTSLRRLVRLLYR